MTAFQKKHGAVGWPRPQADAILRAAAAMGVSLEPHAAQTGTIYLEGWIGDEPIKIRVADHCECYCTEDVSCNPCGLTVRQTVEWLAERAGVAVPRAILSGWKAAETRTARKAAADEDLRSARVTLLRERLAGVADIEWVRAGNCEDPWPSVPAGTPNRRARVAAAKSAIAKAESEVYRFPEENA